MDLRVCIWIVGLCMGLVSQAESCSCTGVGSFVAYYRAASKAIASGKLASLQKASESLQDELNTAIQHADELGLSATELEKYRVALKEVQANHANTFKVPYVPKSLTLPSSLQRKLDNQVFSKLKGQINNLDVATKAKFLDDFANASDEVLLEIQSKNLVGSWKVLSESGETGLSGRIRDLEFVDDFLKKNLRKTTVNVTDDIKKAGGYGKWVLDVAKGADDLIASLTGSIKSTYDELIKAGLKSEVKANSILLKNSTGETVAIIYNGKLTPTKWAWQRNFSAANKTATSDGYIIIKDGSELKFDLGFKEERKLEAKEVNDYLVNGQGKDLDGQPYWAGTQVDEVVLGRKGEIIYFVENYNGGAANPGQYATKDLITTIKELRENLAVKEAWKETAKEPTLRAYRVKTDLKARSGTIGRQSDNGIELPGGAHQYEIIDYLGGNWKSYLEEVGPKNGIKLK